MAIDATPEATIGGIGMYTREIARAMHAEDGQVFSVAPRLRIPFFSRHVLLPLEAYVRGARVMLCPDGHIPLGWVGKAVVVVHDLATYEHPEWFPDVRRKLSTDWLYPRSLRRADAIVVPSEATRLQLARVFPGLEKKAHVIPHGIRPLENMDSTPRTETIVFVGTLEPRKNIVNAIAAFDAFLRAHPDEAVRARFLIGGKEGWGSEPILEAIRQMNEVWGAKAGHDVVVWNGPVNEQEKWSMLSSASALIFPSLWEGFGLPVLEAMSVGTPVITTDRGALPEVAGDAAMYVDPEDTEAMALAIAQCVLMPDAMQEMIAAAKNRASQFTWERAAGETLDIVGQACQTPKSRKSL